MYVCKNIKHLLHSGQPGLREVFSPPLWQLEPDSRARGIQEWNSLLPAFGVVWQAELITMGIRLPVLLPNASPQTHCSGASLRWRCQKLRFRVKKYVDSFTFQYFNFTFRYRHEHDNFLPRHRKKMYINEQDSHVIWASTKRTDQPDLKFRSGVSQRNYAIWKLWPLNLHFQFTNWSCTFYSVQIQWPWTPLNLYFLLPDFNHSTSY